MWKNAWKKFHERVPKKRYKKQRIEKASSKNRLEELPVNERTMTNFPKERSRKKPSRGSER